MTTKVQSR